MAASGPPALVTHEAAEFKVGVEGGFGGDELGIQNVGSQWLSGAHKPKGLCPLRINALLGFFQPPIRPHVWQGWGP